jgi:hypothetical protein
VEGVKILAMALAWKVSRLDRNGCRGEVENSDANFVNV